jgi:magnesium-transporting ATPase (P-type)
MSCYFIVLEVHYKSIKLITEELKMKKGLLSTFMFFAGFLAASVLWLISVILPEGSYLFSEQYQFNFAWFALISCAGVFLCFLIRGFTGGTYKESRVLSKKLNLLLAGAVGVVIALICVNIFTWEDKVILPIIAVIVVLAVVLSVIVTGGKKWDQADNQKSGYKTYAQREAEREKQERNK